jgi:hypothetical protein
MPGRLSTIALVLLACGVAHGQWIHLGPEGGEADTIAIHPTNASIVYAGSLAGVRKSTDGGASWTDADAGITGDTWVLGLVIDPTTPQTLYAGTDGVWKSTDAGVSWTHLTNGIPVDINVVGSHDPMAADPVNPGTVYVLSGVGEGAFKTTDGGTSWMQIAGGATDLEVVLVDPLTPSTVYFGAEASGSPAVQKSTDGGITLTPAATGLPPDSGVGILVAAATNPPTLLAGFYSEGVYRSTDRAASWGVANTGLPATPLQLLDLATDPTTPTIAWAALVSGVYRSTDAGLTWAPTAFPSSEFGQTIVVGPSGCAAVGTFGHGVLQSCDGGAHWTRGIAGYFGVTVGGFWQDSIAAVPVAAGTFLVAGNGAGVFRTPDGGTTWVENTAHPARSATVVGFAPSDPSRVYTFGFAVGGSNGARSSDGGATWVSCGLFPVPDVPLALGLAVDPGNPDVVYASLYSGPLVKSTDGCATFTLLPSPLGIPGDLGWSVAVDPTNTQRVFLATFGGLFESTNGGNTWSTARAGSSNLVRVTADGTVFLGSNGSRAWPSIRSDRRASSSRATLGPASPPSSSRTTGDRRSPTSRSTCTTTTWGRSPSTPRAPCCWPASTATAPRA